VLYLMAPPRVRFALELFMNLVGLAAVLILAYAAWEPAMRAISSIQRTGSAFNSPEPTILKTLLVVGAGLYALQLIANLVKLLRHEEEEPPRLGDEGA
jgi:TRAP-type C4-dicarboxylate transport system permease small subunit